MDIDESLERDGLKVSEKPNVGDSEFNKRWHSEPLISHKQLDTNLSSQQHLDWFLYPLLFITIISTVLFITLLIIILRKYKTNKSCLTETEILQLDKVDSKNSKNTNLANTNKYGTLENIKLENEKKSGLSRIKSSSSWPFNSFILKSFNLISNTKTNKTEYSIAKLDENITTTLNNLEAYTGDHHAEMILNSELISKLTPIKLNYSIKYENLTLKLDIISIELDNKPNISFNPYVRIELINENLKLKNDINKYGSSEKLTKEDENEDNNEFKVCKTRVIRKSLNPVYNETFVFNNVKSLIEYKLILSVYSSNRFTRDLFIGQLVHDFDVVDSNLILSHSYSKELIYDNNESINDKHNTGEIKISLCYKTSSQKIYVNLMKANYLPFVNKNNLPNPFAKIFLTYNNERLTKKLSKIYMQTRNPTFNETFEFDLLNYFNNNNENKEYILNKFGINIVILDWNPIEKCETLGELNLCNDQTKETSNEICLFWDKIFNKQNEVVIATYKLSSIKHT